MNKELFIDTRSYNQTAPNKHGYKINRETIERNIAILAIGLALTVGGNFILNETLNYGDQPEKFGDRIDSATSVELQEGAVLRETPNVENTDGGNVIKVLDDDTTIELSSPAYEHDDEVNGDWYNVSKQDLKAAGINISGKSAWINEQRANIEYADSSEK